MSQLNAKKRAKLPKSAFAYVDSRGRRRLPINDECTCETPGALHQVAFEDERRGGGAQETPERGQEVRDRSIGFRTGQRDRDEQATAGRLVIELGRSARRLIRAGFRNAERRPYALDLHWSDSAGAYLDGDGQPAALPTEGADRAVTLLERQGRPMTALVHDPAVLKNPDLVKRVTAATG